MQQLITYLRVRGMQRGVLGGSRTWLGVWVGLTAVRLIARLLSQPDQVERVQLRKGETIEIRDTGVTWREEKKAAKQQKKAQRRAARKGTR